MDYEPAINGKEVSYMIKSLEDWQFEKIRRAYHRNRTVGVVKEYKFIIKPKHIK